MTAYTSAGAIFNPARTHRFRLWREWDPSKARLAWLMANPSTADEAKLDPTLRRCEGFALAWGFGGFEVFNVATFRTPYPDALVEAHREGVDVFERDRRDTEIAAVAPLVGRAVVAWGAIPLVRDEGPSVARVLALAGVDVVALGRTKDGHPRHPLYMRRDTVPEAWYHPVDSRAKRECQGV